MKAPDKPTILYVDDELENLQGFLFLFNREYNLLIAESAHEGLQKLGEHAQSNNPVRVIITDHRMPDMTGIEFCGRIKKKYPFVPIIFLTAYIDIEITLQAINEIGVYRFISKPFMHEEMRHAIKSAVEYYNLRMENTQLISKLKQANEQLTASSKLVEQQNMDLEKVVEKRTCELKNANISLEAKNKELEKKEKLLRAVIHNANDGITLSDLKGNFEIYNSKISEITGYQFIEVQSDFLSLIYPKDKDREEINNKIIHLIQNKSETTVETSIQTKNNEKKILNVSTSVVEFENNQLLLSFYKDITAQKKAEKELVRYKNLMEELVRLRTKHLKLSEDRYRVLVEHSPSAIIVIKDRKILFINPAGAQMFGFNEPGELVNQNSEQFLTQDTIANFEKKLSDFNANNKTSKIQFDIELKQKDSSDLCIEFRVVPIIFQNKNAVLFIGKDISDYKNTLRELEISEKKYRSIIAHASDAMFIIDKKTERIIEANEKACRFTNYTYSQIINKNILQFHPPYHHQSLREKFFLTSHRNNENEEFLFINEFNNLVTVEINSTHLQLPDKDIVIAIYRDVTKRKQDERLLHLTKFAIDNYSDAVLWINKDSQIIYANMEVHNSLGYSMDEIIQFEISDIDPNFPRSSWHFFLDKIKEQGFLTFETMHKRKDGSFFPVEKNVSFIEYRGETFGCIFARDITERKKADEKLIKLNTALKQSGNAILISDIEGKIEFVNTRFEEITGYTFSEVIGKYPNILKSGKQTNEFYNKLWKRISAGKTWKGVFCNKKKDGTEYWENATITPVKNPKNEIINYIAIKEDITLRKRTDEAIQTILSVVSTKAGSNFFAPLLNKLCEILTANVTVIAEYDVKTLKIKTQAICENGIFHPNTVYNVENTPEEVVIKKGLGIFTKNMVEIFPRTVLGKQFNAQAFVGVPLFNKENFTTGVLFALFDKPLHEPNFVRTILQICSVRTGAEIERWKSDIALKKNEEMLRNVFRSSPNAIIISNIEGAIIQCNDATLNLFGYSKNELLQAKLTDLIAPEENKEYFKKIEQLIVKGKFLHMSFNFLKNDNIQFPGELSASLIFDMNRKPSLIVSVINDISARIITERKLLNTVIETEERERKSFAEDLHDELGPFLSGIKLYINELGYDDINKNQRHEMVSYLKQMVDEAISKTKTISNRLMPNVLMDYGLIRAIQSFCTKINATHVVNISFDVDKPDAHYNKTLEIILYRIIIELINNTIKHAGANQILIKLLESQNHLIIKYHDDGKGFVVKDKSEGPTGLGLLNISNRLKTINGKYEIKSSVNKGMDFYAKIALE